MLTLQQQQALAVKVAQRWRQASEAIAELQQNSRDGWDFYLRNKSSVGGGGKPGMGRGQTLDGVVMNTPKPGLRFGLIPRSVDAVRAYLHNAIFPADERFFRGSPRNELSQKHRELYEQYRAENFAEDNTTETLRQFLLSLCIDDAACLSLHWREKTQNRVTYEPRYGIKFGNMEIPLPGLGLEAKAIENDVVWEGTRVECLDFNDWRVDPQARSLEEAWFIRRWYEPVEVVKARYGLEQLTSYHQGYGGGDEKTAGKSTQKQTLNGVNADAQPPIPLGQERDGEAKALMMVCYDDFWMDGTCYVNHLAITVNGKELVWFGPNPYHHGQKPYIVTSLFPIPGQIYGMSLIRHAIPSAAVVDTLVDKILKISSLAADPIFEVPMSEPALRGDVEIKPGMKIPVKRPNAIRQVPVNVSNLSVLMEMMNRAEENIREITGASPLFTGEDMGSMPSNVTAFQIDQHVQGAQTRFQALINHFNNRVLEPLLQITFENDRQFKTQKEVLPGLGTLTPDLIKQLSYKWIVTASNATQNRAKELANLRSLLLDVAPALQNIGILKFSGDTVELNAPAALRQLLVKAGLNDVDQWIQVKLDERLHPNDFKP